MTSMTVFNTHGTAQGTVNNVNGTLTHQDIAGDYIGTQNNYNDSPSRRGTPVTESEEAPTPQDRKQDRRQGGRRGPWPSARSADTTSRPFTGAEPLDPPVPLHRQSSPSARGTVQPLEQLAEEVLSLTPAPYLKRIWGPFEYIWLDSQQAQASAGQLKALVRSIAQLLGALYEHDHLGNLKDSHAAPLNDLHGVLEDIAQFLCKLQANSEPLKLLLSKTDRIAQIDARQCKILESARAFQIPQLIDMEGVVTAMDEGRAADQTALYERFDAMEKNTGQLDKELGARHTLYGDLPPELTNQAMAVSVRRYLKHEPHVGDDRERQFFEFVARHLSYTIGRARTPDNDTWDWMVSKYDLEFEQEPIGSGGFGQILLGRLGSKEVAVKMFQSQEGVTPQPQVVRGEIETWLKLRHPNVLEFLAANVSDEKPFIVMPYMKNGNAREYLKSHRTCNRVKLLHDASLGLNYLHEQRIVHGDIKAANILIDDEGGAVIADFGLSRVKSDITSSTRQHSAKSAGRQSVTGGSRNWMAPELFNGKEPGRRCDVYSFGITIYEIISGKVPFGNLGPDGLFDAVVTRDARPPRPPNLTNGHKVWDLAEDCWKKSASKRPTAGKICERLKDAMADTNNYHSEGASSISSSCNSQDSTSTESYSTAGTSHHSGDQSGVAERKQDDGHTPFTPVQPAHPINIRRQTTA
ncbi:kinase-like protein [Athelia psychrophila]|uniref:Kinase-like protein n=1 Tax=Athelia psychrophila TaxID=1759441 RepID=A0A166K9S9_9AGAM|nr:kinase-like protein [Fibularhizoctonia sp. CBS 109695]